MTKMIMRKKNNLTNKTKNKLKIYWNLNHNLKPKFYLNNGEN
jgi:hypothetical protein